MARSCKQTKQSQNIRKVLRKATDDKMDLSTIRHYGTAVIEMSPKQLCQSFFFIAASAILFVNSIPAFRQRFISYGSRASQPTADAARDKRTSEDNEGKAREFSREYPSDQNIFSQLLDYVSSFRVPHSWFIHFYLLSVCSSIFWAIQIGLRGRLFESIASRQVAHDSEKQSTFTVNQIFIAWLFMTVQGTRRLYESIVFGKPSKSKMWCVHWILGLIYYLAMGTAIWIEGSSGFLTVKECGPHCNHSMLTIVLSDTLLLNTPLTRKSIVLTGIPSSKSIIAFPLFIVASGIQHDSHFYLSTLKKYTLPSDLFFSQIVCPHYTMECLIYLSLAIMAAPQGYIINKTIFAGLVFVTVNLGVTAQITKEWYAERFGKEKVEQRWVMFPLVY